MTSTSHDLATVDLGGTVLGEVLRASDKSVLARGHRDGHPVVIKALCTDEEFWQAKFAHEIQLYRAFTENPPPVRVPRLVHTDGRAVLVIEHIPGHVIDTERYPDQPLPAASLDAVLHTTTAFAQWNAPQGVLAPVFDYPDRVERYHRAGFFDAGDRAVLLALLNEVAPPASPAHGDPLPANLLLTEHDECVLLDFEFTGQFMPGFDLAMLHTLLAATPGAHDRIEALVDEAGIGVPFLINQAMVLSRELRLHTELPDGEFREKRLALLRPQWDAFRARLHTRR
ncbi:aminoglycoside phosphotransferase (plasmid) [Prauserella marina]|uniref:Choline/ethanolamine kinase n=1 Tax=Prauserella marina TaxID=530584 RepID=A0A222W1A2_9PSEU|nr:phosphotransferase [Prauserella marina]ASR39925.1 aminoglycoside phosphotransferase [Prauserella marina]PWV71425.1 choline/ethanolamine kinase [Prauserella marina]SDD97960.1 Choline/ethanolamine kinase [Prauserella marina]